jgi:hypothetical protein
MFPSRSAAGIMVIIKNHLDLGFSIVNGSGYIYNYQIVDNDFVKFDSYIECTDKLSSVAYCGEKHRQFWVCGYHKQGQNINLISRVSHFD